MLFFRFLFRCGSLGLLFSLVPAFVAGAAVVIGGGEILVAFGVQLGVQSTVVSFVGLERQFVILGIAWRRLAIALLIFDGFIVSHLLKKITDNQKKRRFFCSTHCRQKAPRHGAQPIQPGISGLRIKRQVWANGLGYAHHAGLPAESCRSFSQYLHLCLEARFAAGRAGLDEPHAGQHHQRIAPAFAGGETQTHRGLQFHCSVPSMNAAVGVTHLAVHGYADAKA